MVASCGGALQSAAKAADARDCRCARLSAADAVSDRVYKARKGGKEQTMAGSVNKVILIGNLGKDPEVRRLNSGDPVVSFPIATSESWRDKTSGERKERTEWHNIVIFNENLGKVAEQYCKKGTKVYVEGQMQTRKWQDQSGNDRYTTEIVLTRFRGELQLLDSRGGGDARDSFPDENGSRSFARPSSGERKPALSSGGGAGPLDDDIPF